MSIPIYIYVLSGTVLHDEPPSFTQELTALASILTDNGIPGGVSRREPRGVTAEAEGQRAGEHTGSGSVSVSGGAHEGVLEHLAIQYFASQELFCSYTLRRGMSCIGCSWVTGAIKAHIHLNKP